MEFQNTPSLWSLSKCGGYLAGLISLTWFSVQSIEGNVLDNPALIFIGLLFSLLLSVSCVFLAELTAAITCLCCRLYSAMGQRPPRLIKQD